VRPAAHPPPSLKAFSFRTRTDDTCGGKKKRVGTGRAKTNSVAYSVIPEPGEKIEAQIELNLSRKAQPFFFAISNRAIYIPRIKLIAKSDPYYFQRVPLKEVQQVAIRRLRSQGLWVLSVIMIVIGFFTTIWMMEPILRNVPGRHEVSGHPIAVFVCGFLVPYAAKGRFGLEVSFNGGTFRWKPPLVVDKQSKGKIGDAFQAIVDGCRAVGAPLSDGRAPVRIRA